MPDQDGTADGKRLDENGKENESCLTDSHHKTVDKGIALIKSQYIDHDHKKKLVEEYLPQEIIDSIKEITKCDEAGAENSANGESVEPPIKRQKLKGRYKNRRNEKKPEDSDKICHSILKGLECRFGDRCKFLHDVQEYLANKPEDIGDSCYMFLTYGRCPYGLACRYGSSHIKDGKNVVNEKLHANFVNKKLTCNALDKNVQLTLRKKKYNFQKANEVFNDVTRSVRNTKEVNEVEKGLEEEPVAPHKSKDPCVDPAAGSEPGKDVLPSSERLDSTTDVTETKDQITSELEATRESLGNVNQKCDTTQESLDKINQICNTTQESHGKINQTWDTTCESHGKVNQTCDTTQVKSLEGAQLEAQELVDSSESSETHLRVKLENLSTTGVDEEGIKLRPLEKRKVDFRDKLYLAPLTTVGNLPFRRVCKEYGVDITCGEMAMSTNLLQGKNSEWALLRRHHTEDLFGVQLCGSFPDTMARCGQLIVEQAEVDFIDINCGCPIDLVYKKGGGCALMSRTHKFEQIVRGMVSVLDVPLTIKMRTGIFEDKSTAHQILPKLREWGVSMCTIHGRSREQRYTKLADWEYINECARAGQPMPIYGNGDILSYVDANFFRETTGVSGLMIARGALIKPWIFTEIKEQRHWDISSSERLDMLKRFVHHGLEHWGSDTQGVASVRRFLLEWLSFLHRYIPVGILEHLPQKINEKPPYYFGRDDLETMMASPNSADWVKLSEMLIGRVPEGFTFVPKHKANAYK